MNKRKTGAVYEEKAAAYLKEKGYRILEKNYRCPFGEMYLMEHGMCPCRFDVAAINGTEITLVRNAFECR